MIRSMSTNGTRPGNPFRKGIPLRTAGSAGPMVGGRQQSAPHHSLRAVPQPAAPGVWSGDGKNRPELVDAGRPTTFIDTGDVIVAGEGRAIVQTSAQDVLEFALDIDRHRQVDPKFYKVYRHRMDGDAGEIRYSGTLRGIPTPPDTQSIGLARWIRLDYKSVPSPLNRLARFHGWFERDARDDVTHVRHREQFEFSPLVAWLAAPILRRWLLSSRSSPVGHQLRRARRHRGRGRGGLEVGAQTAVALASRRRAVRRPGRSVT
jgi:hypothetical protein